MKIGMQSNVVTIKDCTKLDIFKTTERNSTQINQNQYKLKFGEPDEIKI